MMMPDKVTGWKPKDGSVYFYDPNPEWLARQSEDEIDVIHMVRADIADKLARALELFMMSAHDYQTGLQEGEDALARYHAATEGK